jgi:hypothetical protein
MKKRINLVIFLTSLVIILLIVDAALIFSDDSYSKSGRIEIHEMNVPSGIYLHTGDTIKGSINITRQLSAVIIDPNGEELSKVYGAGVYGIKGESTTFKFTAKDNGSYNFFIEAFDGWGAKMDYSYTITPPTTSLNNRPLIVPIAVAAIFLAIVVVLLYHSSKREHHKLDRNL